LEEYLGLPLNPNVRSILQRVNLDTVSFNDMDFGGGGDYITTLMESNIDEDLQVDDPEVIYLALGGSTAYFLLMENKSGDIFAVDHEDTSKRIHIADNFRNFFLTAATIADIRSPNFKNKSEAEIFFTQRFDDLGITLGRRFWLLLARKAL
jgi:hypothetical protein